jgi:hypothetical protein
VILKKVVFKDVGVACGGDDRGSVLTQEGRKKGDFA